MHYMLYISISKPYRNLHLCKKVTHILNVVINKYPHTKSSRIWLRILAHHVQQCYLGTLIVCD
jgi:hypothetical protein